MDCDGFVIPENNLIETLNPSMDVVVGAENHSIDGKTSEGNGGNAECGHRGKGWPGLGCVSKNVNLGRLESQINQYQRIKPLGGY